MPHGYTEDGLVEQPAIKLFAELGWQTASGEGETFGATGSLGRASNREPVLAGRLRAALERLNPKAPASAIASAIDALTQDRSAMSLVGANREVYGQGGSGRRPICSTAARSNFGSGLSIAIRN